MAAITLNGVSLNIPIVNFPLKNYPINLAVHTWEAGILPDRYSVRFDGTIGLQNSYGWLDGAFNPFILNKSFSISMWYRPENEPAPHAPIVMQSFLPPAEMQYGWGIYTKKVGVNQLIAFELTDGVAGNIGVNIITSTTPITLDTWHHVVATVEGTEMKLYVDNVLEATGTATGEMVQEEEVPMLISCFPFLYPLISRVAELVIYRSTIDEYEINRLFNLEAPNQPEAYYKFTEGLGDKAYDSITPENPDFIENLNGLTISNVYGFRGIPINKEFNRIMLLYD